MNPYKFNDTDFALSEKGVHLLRSGFDYKTIPFDRIQTVTVVKSSPVKNPLLTLLVGLLLVGFALGQSYRKYQDFNDPEVYHIYIESIVVIVLPLFVGIYMLYLLIKKELMLLIKTDQTTYKLSVKSLDDNGLLPAAELYLKKQISGVEDTLNIL